jgi:acyl dehydratase
MSIPDFDSLNIGDELPVLVKLPINRTTLALFAGASNDHNPIHIDIDYAKKAGFDDVFAHGMLVMAYLGQMLTNWVPQKAIKKFDSRFQAITHIGDQLSCKGIIVEKFQEGDQKLVTLSLSVIDQNQEEKISGNAVVDLNLI